MKPRMEQMALEQFGNSIGVCWKKKCISGLRLNGPYLLHPKIEMISTVCPKKWKLTLTHKNLTAPCRPNLLSPLADSAALPARISPAAKLFVFSCKVIWEANKKGKGGEKRSSPPPPPPPSSKAIPGLKKKLRYSATSPSPPFPNSFFCPVTAASH